MLKTKHIQRRFATGCLIIMALALFFLKVPFALKDPFFTGDSGFRMHHAHRLVVILENDIWLPFLQLHIWIFHKLGLPYYVYKLIPCLYFLLAALFLGRLTYRLIGRDYSGLLFGLLLLFCFAYHPAIMFLGINLYQEMLAIALFYMLLYMGALDLKKSKSLLAVAAIALLTRESFWIYLLVLSLLNYRRILSDRGYLFTFICLWAIPLLWIGSVPFAYLVIFKRWPQWPIEWPLMINRQSPFTIPSFLTSLRSLKAAIAADRLHFLAAGLVTARLLRVLYFRYRERVAVQGDAFDVKFKTFSLASLAACYSLVALFNPWECTYGNMRMGVPLLYHLFIWAALFYKETFDYPKALKITVRLTLILSLLAVIDTNTGSWLARGNPRGAEIYSEFERLTNHTYGNRKPRVCIAGDNYWESLERFIAPTLYMRRKFVTLNEDYDAKDYDIVITPLSLKDNNFLKYKEFKLGDDTYVIYIKSPARPARG